VGEPLVEIVDKILGRLGHKVYDVNPVEPPESQDETDAARKFIAERNPVCTLTPEESFPQKVAREYFEEKGYVKPRDCMQEADGLGVQV
jgi:hypothetical protein